MDLAEVIENYKHGELLKAIEEALKKMNVSTKDVTLDTLGPVDEFHIGGRAATAHFTARLGFSRGNRILDLGCGLGGAARYVAHQFHCKVEGIDLSSEYVEAGRALNAWVNLAEQVCLTQGSALELPYPDNHFDGAYQLHVGMNINNKELLFKEVCRVLKPNASFGIFDILKTGDGELQYPVPWASNATISHLATLDDYKSKLEKAGFKIVDMESRKEFALEFAANLKARSQTAGGPPPLGLHTLMQSSTALKLQNMISGVSAGIIAPFEIVGQKL